MTAQRIGDLLSKHVQSKHGRIRYLWRLVESGKRVLYFLREDFARGYAELQGFQEHRVERALVFVIDSGRPFLGDGFFFAIDDPTGTLISETADAIAERAFRRSAADKMLKARAELTPLEQHCFHICDIS